jgi:transposase
LVETRQCQEKFVYEWRLDSSRVGDITAARKILPNLPANTIEVEMDGAYDASDLYEIVEQQGAAPIIKPRANARTGTLDARGRALRDRLRHPAKWQRRYNRRPITEAVNSSLKRRFGDRLHCRGLWNQRQEMAIRILVYNIALKGRWNVRMRIQRGDS